MTLRRFATLLMVIVIAIWLSFLFASCSSLADAQTPPDILHRDFGATTCYYTISANGDVSALSCVK